MAERPKLVPPTVEEVETPGHIVFHIRGKLYEIDEITATEYEQEAAKATNPQEDTVDMNMVTKLITLRAVKVEGAPLDPETWGKEKFPVVNRVQNEVRRLHYIEVETDEEAVERKKAEKEAAAAADRKKRKEGPDLPNS